MITIEHCEKFYTSEFTQETYDNILAYINFKEEKCSCGAKGSLVKIGCYSRFYKTSTKRICIKIQRVMCKHCGKTHAVFVECMVPSSMLLVSTQIEMLRSYYNHSLDEFLANYPSIDRPNVFYIVKNYERKWKKYLESAGLTLTSNEKEITDYFLEKHHIQFMQMKRHLNSSSKLLLNLQV